MAKVNRNNQMSIHKGVENFQLYSTQAAKALLPRVPYKDRSSLAPHAHTVQFYGDKAFPVDDLSRYLGSALGAGGGAIIIATKPHRAQVTRRLKLLGIDVTTAAGEGRYVSLDAAETLSRFMVAGWPDEARFTGYIGATIKRVAASIGEGSRTAAFGEMVALLWAEGKCDAAIRLEELWHRLIETHTFDLHCAYPMSYFERSEDGKGLNDICEAHSYVIPAESYTSLSTDEERFRAIVALQQKALALETQLAEHKRTQQALERREAELNDFFENASVGLHWVGPDGAILRANQAELDMLGYTREEYLGHQIADFHVDPEVIADILARLSAGEILHDYPARLRCKDGSIKHVLINSNVLWEDGKFVHTRCFTRDITASKQTEIALRASEARFRTMADTVPVMVWVSDINKQRTYFNKCWFEFTGRTLEQDLGYGWTENLHPADLARYLELYEASFDARSEFKIEYRLRRFDGEYRWVLSHGAPFFLSDGTFSGFIGSSMDITERVEMEERKDAFIALASHELKTPITSLKLFTQLLKKRFEKAEDDQFDAVLQFARMNSQIDKLAGLVQSLLDISKIQAGKLDYSMEPVAVDELLADVVDDLQKISSTHTIELDAHAGVTLCADRDRVRQVLINLIMNAIKFSPAAHEVWVRSRVDEAERSVTISVQDFGIGIPASEHEKIFDRFFQARPINGNGTLEGSDTLAGPQSDTYPGLGLGLFICAEVVNRHGGRIWVESQPGQGSTFYFTLPL
jgi:PAS domain S-box-containing protein